MQWLLRKLLDCPFYSSNENLYCPAYDSNENLMVCPIYNSNENLMNCPIYDTDKNLMDGPTYVSNENLMDCPTYVSHENLSHCWPELTCRRINLAGLGIGDGWMSPYHNARYGKFLYQVGNLTMPGVHYVSTCARWNIVSLTVLSETLYL